MKEQPQIWCYKIADIHRFNMQPHKQPIRASKGANIIFLVWPIPALLCVISISGSYCSWLLTVILLCTYCLYLCLFDIITTISRKCDLPMTGKTCPASTITLVRQYLRAVSCLWDLVSVIEGDIISKIGLACFTLLWLPAVLLGA